MVCTVALLLVSAVNSAVINPGMTQLMTNFGPTSQEITRKLVETEIVDGDTLQVKIDTPDIDFVNFTPKQLVLDLSKGRDVLDGVKISVGVDIA